MRLFNPAVHPRFDDLPWSQPLAEWDHPRLVSIPSGLHRHVVRFVEYGGQIFALKELPARPAHREYRLLRMLNDRGLPVVAAVALVEDRGDPEPVVITRYLNYALPLRHYVRGRDSDDLSRMLVTSIATLLARLHTAGFYWGDCSLSNAVFRRDATYLSAYALDAETGDLHDRLSAGQRHTDVEIAIVNVAGGLADLEAAGQLPEGFDPFDVAPRIGTEYDRIWDELHGASEYDRANPISLRERLDRLHGLGFSVREAVITGSPDSDRLEFRPEDIEEGHNRRELFRLTGLRAREQQARRLLDHIAVVRAGLSASRGEPVSTEEAAHRWLTDAFDPVLASIPTDVAGKLEQPQLFLEVLDHQRASGRADALDDLLKAARDYGRNELVQRPPERTPARSD